MSCVTTLKKMLDEVPDMDASLRLALQGIVDGVFLELPEDDTVWLQAQCELVRVIPLESRQLQWHRQVIKIWTDAVNSANTSSGK